MAKTTCDWPHREAVTPRSQRDRHGWKDKERVVALTMVDGVGNKLRLCRYHGEVVGGLVAEALKQAVADETSTE